MMLAMVLTMLWVALVILAMVLTMLWVALLLLAGSAPAAWR